MNKVILVGRLTRDPEVKYTPSGRMVATFTLAVDRPFTAAAKEKGEREADFVPIVVWGNTAEFCGNYLNKGSKILVDGRLQLRTYDGKDGQRRYVTEVIANSIEALERRTNAAPKDESKQVKESIESFGKDIDVNDEVPF